MKKTRTCVIFLLLVWTATPVLYAEVLLVPEQHNTIGDAVLQAAPAPGSCDTISVWGPRPGEPAERVLPAGVHVLQWDAEVPARPQPRPSP